MSDEVKPSPVEPSPIEADAVKPGESAPARPYISNPFGLIPVSWEAFKLILGPLVKLWLGVSGIIILLLAVGAGIGFVTGGNPVVIAVLVIIAVAVIIPLSIYTQWMATYMILEAVAGRRTTVKGSRPASWKPAFQLFVTNLLAGLAILGGFMLFIIPGIIFSAWFALVSYVAVREGIYGGAALGRSRELTRGRLWEIFGTTSLTSAFGIFTLIPVVGFILYIFAALATVPIMAVRYTMLTELKTKPEWENVPVSPLNYLAVVLAIIYFGVNTQQSLQNAKDHPPVEKSASSY